MHPDGARLSRPRAANDWLHRQRTGRLRRVAREQRIDVTGHVASGFIKSLEIGIDGP
jgi:hypothetical protein